MLRSPNLLNGKVTIIKTGRGYFGIQTYLENDTPGYWYSLLEEGVSPSNNKEWVSETRPGDKLASFESDLVQLELPTFLDESESITVRYTKSGKYYTED